jgi:hypothetical protein
MMMSVFLDQRYYAAHLGRSSRPFLGCFGEKMFNSRGGNMDEQADGLISIIFETVNRATRGVDAVARR